jgi:integrase
VFASKVGTPLDPSHVRRDFRRAIRETPGLSPTEWTPRELRHSFVSLLSDSGVPLEEISRLVGHSSTAVTELGKWDRDSDPDASAGWLMGTFTSPPGRTRRT